MTNDSFNMAESGGEHVPGHGSLLRSLAVVFLLLTGFLGLACEAVKEEVARPPNVILLITDDQGWGDLSLHGNQNLQTPNMDRLASEGVEFTRFYASPVCAPTRASLMTGRYNYRTGVVDTWLGRAMMYPDEVTLAEVLGSYGYQTGIFGKWHLGDNYPMRAMDQGFQESLVHRGGGIGQPSDPPGNTYFDPVLLHNGRDTKATGYCTDIFFREAAEFIEENRDVPFFVYIPTNAPHSPLQVPDEYVQPYLDKGVDERTAKVYGMIWNIDSNLGILMEQLQALGLDENTILIFMTDNGHAGDRYSSGLRGRKTSVYEGGIRVPFLLRWPARVPSNLKVDHPAAHIDIMPTLIEICGSGRGELPEMDGKSLLPLLIDPDSEWDERYLFIQSHRGDVPERRRACTVLSRRFKLVQPQGWPAGSRPEDPKWELYDLLEDPGEATDLADQNPDIVARMSKAYEAWFVDVSSTRGYNPPRIHMGTQYENPVILTRQDWRGPRASWNEEGLGYWEVDVISDSTYEVNFRFPAMEGAGVAEFSLGEVSHETEFPLGATSVKFSSVRLPAGPGRLEAVLLVGDSQLGVHYVDVALQGTGRSP